MCDCSIDRTYPGREAAKRSSIHTTERMNESEKLTKDEIFEVLSSSRRRQILYHLHRRGGTAQLRDLARDTAAAERSDSVTDTDPASGNVDRGAGNAESVGEDVVKRLYISLYQTHVPKLEEVGLVRYDSDEKTVTLTDSVAQIARVMDEDVTPDERWALYYASLAIAGLVLALAQLSGLAPSIATLLFAVVLLLLAGYQYYETTLGDREYDFLEQLITEVD